MTTYQATTKNVERAERAQATLGAYKQSLGESGPVDMDTVRDFFQDLLHWHQQNFPDEDTLAEVRERFDTACNDWPNEWSGEAEC